MIYTIIAIVAVFSWVTGVLMAGMAAGQKKQEEEEMVCKFCHGYGEELIALRDIRNQIEEFEEKCQEDIREIEGMRDSLTINE